MTNSNQSKLKEKNIVFLFTFVICSVALTACLRETKNYSPGECLNPVDGNHIWKVSQSSPLKGFEYRGTDWATKEETLPDHIYSRVPCPKKSSQ